MSPPGRPKGEIPLGGKARSAKGAHTHPPGRPKGEIPLGGKARSAKGAHTHPPGRPKGEVPPGGKARSAKGAHTHPPGRPKGEIPLDGKAHSAQDGQAGSPGTLHLIPVGLGEAAPERWLPAEARALAAGLDTYIAENAKTARAFLKQIGTVRQLQEITIHTLTDKTDAAQIQEWLGPVRQGADIGLVSEAGCPAVADPGARVADAAHRLGLTVRPWVGPSSILLGLMASGLDGQRFAFHGYAPVEPEERARQLRAWEQLSGRHNQTQMLIETPYRNAAMFATLVDCLRGDTRLCVARSLTTADEWIRTRTVADWKTQPTPDLDKKPTLFLYLAK